jgi:hypothetical protein
MFSNRWWVLKLALALAFFALVFQLGGNRMAQAHPELERIAVYTDDVRDKTFALIGRKVIAADAAGFEIGSRVGPIRVLTPHPPPAGAYVSLIGRATAPRTLTASSLQINAGWAWKRPLNYALSIFVVVAYLWIVRDRFRWRIPEGVFRGRY